MKCSGTYQYSRQEALKGNDRPARLFCQKNSVSLFGPLTVYAASVLNKMNIIYQLNWILAWRFSNRFQFHRFFLQSSQLTGGASAVFVPLSQSLNVIKYKPWSPCRIPIPTWTFQLLENKRVDDPNYTLYWPQLPSGWCDASCHGTVSSKYHRTDLSKTLGSF